MTDKVKDISAIVPQSEYDALIGRIDNLWTQAKNRAVEAVNTELLDANWQTGQYIVEFEQKGQIRAEYGKFLITRLAKDLTVRRGRGFSRSNLIYMRKFYLCFPKSETVSHLLTWSHYFELLKCEDSMEMQFYFHEAITQKWKLRELKRQNKSSRFQRRALNTDKKGHWRLLKSVNAKLLNSVFMLVTRFSGLQTLSHFSNDYIGVGALKLGSPIFHECRTIHFQPDC